MRLVINSNNYGDIKTAVFYKSHKFIPKENIREEDINSIIYQCTSDRVFYQGNKNSLISKDFAEYDFSYLIEKYKFNDKILMSLADNYTKDIVGIEESDIEKTEKTLFPTISVGDTIGKGLNYDYFGTTLIQNQNFYLFEVPGSTINSSGYYKIELYENSITQNNDRGGFIETELLQKLDINQTELPILTIILGPDELVKNNSSKMYYPYDSRLIEKEKSLPISDYEYACLLEEVNMDNVVSLFLGKDNTVTDINLAYKSWLDNDNPNRNENQYNLRNDEYFSSIDNASIIEKDNKSKFILDKNSDTILANKRVTSTPLLQSRLEKIDKDKYSPYIHYNKGDIVYLGFNPVTGDRYLWESLIDNNFDNNPFISNTWIDKKKIKDFFTRRVNIETDPIDAGAIIPGDNITITSQKMNVNFIVNEELGYEILEDNPCYDDNGTPLDNVTVSLVEQGSSFIKEVHITDWKRYIDNPDLTRLIFKYTPVKSLINLVATDKPGITVNYQDWEDYFGDENFKINTIETYSVDSWETEKAPSSNSMLPSFSEGYNLQVKPKQKVLIYIRDLKKIMITSVISTYYINNKKKEKLIDLKYENNDKDVIIEDYVDFSRTRYLFTVKIREFEVLMNKFTDFIVSDVKRSIKYGEDCIIKFYRNNDEVQSFNSIEIINSQGEELSIKYDKLDTPITLGDTIIKVTKENDIFSIRLNNVLSNFKIEIK